MTENSLDRLEERLKALEESIVPGREENEPSMIDSLTTVSTEMNMLASSRERVNQIFKRVPELQEYLRPGFAEVEAMDVSAQQEYILLIEDQIRGTADQLKRIRELAPVLDSEPIRDFRKHNSKLNQLNIKQLEQLEQTTNVSKDLMVLMKQYNKLTQQLSEHFVEMDRIITAMELRKTEREAED